MTFRLGRARLGTASLAKIIETHQCGDAPDHCAVEGFRAVMRTDIGRSGERVEGVEPIHRNESADRTARHTFILATGGNTRTKPLTDSYSVSRPTPRSDGFLGPAAAVPQLLTRSSSSR
jgi:hypothetical protein